MSHPTYPHTGSGPSSYYQQPPPPPPPHVYGTHSPVPRPPNYYATYPGPPPPPLHQQMSAHQVPPQQYHQPGPSRGTPRGHYGSRGGHSYHHNYQQPHLQQHQQHPQQHQQHPQQHQHQHHHQHQHQHATHYPHTHVVNPALVPHHPHPQHPQHPQHSHTSQQMYTPQLAKYNQYTPTSYSYPSPTAPVFTPSWQTQQALGIEALPKQLSMGQQTYQEPSVTTGEDVSNVDGAVATAENTPEPTELEPTEPTENLEPPTEETYPTTTTTTFTTSSTTSPSHPQSPALSSPATPSPSTPSISAAILTSAHIQTQPQPQPQTHSPSYLQMGSISTFEPSSPNPNAPTSSTRAETSQHPRNPPQWAIWSRRPHDPTHAPGIIISPRARPPAGVVLAALEGGTPPSSERSSPRIGTRAIGGNKFLKEVDGGNVVGVPVGVKVGVVDEARIEAWVSQTNSSVSVSVPSSSAVTEVEAETPLVPGSPASSSTSVSVSAVVNNQAKEKEKEKEATEKAATIDTAEDAIPAPEASSTQATTTPARSELGLGEGKSEERATTTTSGEMGAATAPTAAPIATSSTSASTAPATTSTSTPASGATTPAPTATTTPAPPPPKKLWASLLRPSSSTSPSSAPGGAPQRNALPTSSIVGFSIPASALNGANNGNGNPNANGASGVAVSGMKKSELVNLLTVGPAPPPTSAAAAVTGGLSAGAGAGAGGIGASSGTALRIRPRGLVNSGNMCFANSVLQVLVYCPPFHRLFVELGRLLVGPVVGNNKDSSEKNNRDNLEKNASSSATPLVDATVEFLREFVEDRRRKDRRLEVVSRNGGGVGGAKGAGKGKEREVVREEEEEDWDGESFLPTYVYDAMKAKKRFDNMRGGHQEDAEEFFGFYLDTLEEELLSILHSVNPPPKAASNKGSGSVAMVEEKEEAAPPEDDGWLEVGKRNRMVVTRTIKATESPITRMFGGKFRSTLRASGQKDSVVVEDWRSLRLDIQRDQIHTIEDALSYISHPQPVQLTQSARPGVTIEAHQQVLIEALPPILVLHIKRFCYDTAVNGVVKVGKQVKFGPELVIGADVMVPAAKRAQPARYKLFGALYHHGLSASGGHYTLDVLHPNRYPNVSPSAKPREGWVRIDDDLVSDVRPEDVFGATEKEDSRCAYLLFYRRL